MKIINDAAMQAFGSYKGGTMPFLSLGTGLGSTLIIRGHIAPMELGAVSLRKGTIEGAVGARGLKRAGLKKWRKIVEFIAARITSALLLDDTVIGGARMWQPAGDRMSRTPERPRSGEANSAKGARP